MRHESHETFDYAKHRFDTSHPISSIYGDTGKLDQAAQALPEIDVWGINSYRGISYPSSFRALQRARKPAESELREY